MVNTGGYKQTVYFDTGRLQGYPLCEIDFFHFLIGSSIRDWSIEMWEVLPQKLVTPKNWLPPKIDFKKMATPKKIVTPKNWSKKDWLPQKNVTPQKLKKNGYPKNVGVLYCEGVYYCILEKWRTLLRTGLLMRFKHYLLGLPSKPGFRRPNWLVPLSTLGLRYSMHFGYPSTFEWLLPTLEFVVPWPQHQLTSSHPSADAASARCSLKLLRALSIQRDQP